MGEEEVELLLREVREQISVEEELKAEIRKLLGVYDRTQTEGEC